MGCVDTKPVSGFLGSRLHHLHVNRKENQLNNLWEFPWSIYAPRKNFDFVQKPNCFSSYSLKKNVIYLCIVCCVCGKAHMGEQRALCGSSGSNPGYQAWP